MTSSDPHPLPPAPLPPASAVPAHPTKKKLYQVLAEGRSAVEGDHEEARLLLTSREGSFRRDLRWVLYNKYVPSLIQDGPQCGLVALCMAARLLHRHTHVPLHTVAETAVRNGYTAQGEIFSAADMARLAEETCGCRAEHLTGGMGGANTDHILKHLMDGKPVLIPYDEDYNHEPCQRNGHRAHWAVASGALLGVMPGLLDGVGFHGDAVVPWLLVPRGDPHCPLHGLQEAFVLAKQGKSLRYQLWELQGVIRSNAQLSELHPDRLTDGSVYVTPPGGVGAGLAGQVVLLHPLRQTY